MASSSVRRVRGTLGALSTFNRSFSATSARPISTRIRRALPSTTPQSASLSGATSSRRHCRSTSALSTFNRSFSASFDPFCHPLPENFGSYLKRSNPEGNFGAVMLEVDGCDYDLWRIFMEFPEDNNLSPQQMIRIFEETCAMGLNISVKEAKRIIYGYNTTTLTSFNAVMTTQDAKKFQYIPGIAFVVPDLVTRRIRPMGPDEVQQDEYRGKRSPEVTARLLEMFDRDSEYFRKPHKNQRSYGEEAGDVVETELGSSAYHVITMNTGEDVVSKIIEFSHNGARVVTILSATGSVSRIAFDDFDGCSDVTAIGHYDLLSLCGSYGCDGDDANGNKGELRVSLTDSDGVDFGGVLGDSMIAASPIQLILASFKQNITSNT